MFPWDRKSGVSGNYHPIMQQENIGLPSQPSEAKLEGPSDEYGMILGPSGE